MKTDPSKSTAKVTEATEDARQTYEAPRMEIEELFEVLALTCGKVQGNPHQTGCITVPRVS